VAETGENMSRKFMEAYRKPGPRGILRMNFNFMPELGWRSGYVGALALRIAVGRVSHFYFRKTKWL